MDAPLKYLNNLTGILQIITHTQLESIEACAKAFAATIESGKRIFLFGTGHSHMLAEELFYRAGGLVTIQPILEPALMLHESASGSTQAERRPGVAETIFAKYEMQQGDTVVIISNSGRNAVCIDLALLAKQKGLLVVALTSIAHASSATSRHPCGKKLHEIADIVLDNCCCAGDASVYFEQLGRNAAPTSTSAGAGILNAVVAGCIEKMIEDGFTPEVFASSNVDGGDRINDAYIQKYKDAIRFL